MTVTTDLSDSPAVAQLLGSEHRGALVVIDVQRSFADPQFLTAFGLDDAQGSAVADAITRTEELVAEARALNIPVVWVELGSDPDVPWRASNWIAGQAFDAPVGADYPCVVGTPGAEWFQVSPRAGEPVVVKPRYSGFQGTDLETVLRDLGVTWLVMAGLTTECCVATTAFDACQRDFPVIVSSDATAAYESDVHEAALKQLSYNAAVIATSADIAQLWRSAATEWKVAS
ncbi:cysteine hydrolase family protein [Demequina sediminicola]|uniref:cysteine hydrolase family protein n=1 Tax=Demequina sediminicola TaxID=1095026 RepID=UPI0007807275|nr:isochorismatase family cysteine hydrolase [Demequina sediminicola]